MPIMMPPRHIKISPINNHEKFSTVHSRISSFPLHVYLYEYFLISELRAGMLTCICRRGLCCYGSELLDLLCSLEHSHCGRHCQRPCWGLQGLPPILTPSAMPRAGRTLQGFLPTTFRASFAWRRSLQVYNAVTFYISQCLLF
jgi:hypothetical protein